MRGLRPSSLRMALGAMVLAATLTGCTSGHSVLGTTSSPCFKALPAATAAVHRRGTMLGVRSYPADVLIRIAPRLARNPQLVALGRQTVCVVAYRGDFQPGQVDKATTRHGGRYALVIVDANNDEVVTSAILRFLPLRFRHLGPF